MDTGLLVDPAVARAKFARELSDYRRQEDEYIRRGWWMVRAEYPEVFVVFGTPHLKPPSAIFGVLLDFTNYDFWPPSVKLVNPFTKEPFLWKELPAPARLHRSVPVQVPIPAPLEAMGVPAGQVINQVQTLMQSHGPDLVPFLCLAGVREYHQHPGHTGDHWLQYRRSGRGTLADILNTIYKYGVEPVTYDIQTVFQIVYQQQGVPQ